MPHTPLVPNNNTKLSIYVATKNLDITYVLPTFINIIQGVIACIECASPLWFLLGLDVHNFPEWARMCSNVPECARMCPCYGLECAAAFGWPVTIFRVSHVCAWGEILLGNVNTYTSVPSSALDWMHCCLCANHGAHVFKDVMSAHWSPIAGIDNGGPARSNRTRKTDLFIFPCWPIDHPRKIKNFSFSF